MDTTIISLQSLELVSVVFNLLYVILLMRENSWCWACGIIGSALGAYLMYHTKLYSETILYLFYIVVGVYGWWVWERKRLQNGFHIRRWGMGEHLAAIGIGLAGSLLFGWYFSKNTDAELPWVDAHTTVFAFVASYMQAHKILSSWIFWIAINGVTVWLYATKGLDYYTWLMVVYLGLSVWGYAVWLRVVNTRH